MTTLLRSHFEKFLLIGTGIAWLLAGAWCWRRETVVPQSLRLGNRANEDYQPAVLPARPVVRAWEPPVAQPAGSAWIFEVFSPPLIHLDAGTGKFTAGPTRVSDGERSEPGIRLLAVRAAPYRVQLQGGFELAGGYVAALVAAETKEVWCAKPGARWVAMSLVLERVDVGIAALPPDDQISELRHFARALVRDERTGERVTLVSGVQALTRELLATIRLPNNSEAKNLREGDIWRDGESTYRVDRLSLDPAVVAVVTEMGPGGQVNETFWLRPDQSDASDPGRSMRAESSAQPHSLNNGP